MPVSISRTEPRQLPFRYRRYPALAPCDAAWNAADEEGYERAYRAQLEELGSGRIVAALQRISEESDGAALILCCWERPEPGAFCHRWTLSRWLRAQTGVEIPELRAGDLPRKPDAQPTLFEEGYREERA